MMRAPATLAVFVFAASPALAQSGPDATGLWSRTDGNSRVKIERCGADLCVTNLWIRDTSRGEAVGDRLIMSLKPRNATTLRGTAWDPKSQRTYTLNVRVTGNRMTMNGCILGGLVCRSFSWTRVN